ATFVTTPSRTMPAGVRGKVHRHQVAVIDLCEIDLRSIHRLRSIVTRHGELVRQAAKSALHSEFAYVRTRLVLSSFGLGPSSAADHCVSELRVANPVCNPPRPTLGEAQMEVPMVSLHLQCLRVALISLLLAAVLVPTAGSQAGEPAPSGQAV